MTGALIAIALFVLVLLLGLGCIMFACSLLARATSLLFDACSTAATGQSASMDDVPDEPAMVIHPARPRGFEHLQAVESRLSRQLRR